MSDVYTRSQNEYEALLGTARKEFGDKLHLNIVRLNQNENFEMFAVPMRQDLCQLLFQRLPRTYNNLMGIQRAFKHEKINDITKAAKTDTHYNAPGSIVVTVDSEKPWLKVQWNGDSKKTGEFVVDLRMIAKELDRLKPGDDGSLEEEKFKVGYMIDAHHRTEGHYQAGRMELEMVAVAFVDLDIKRMAHVFSQVNDKQEKPSPTHTLAMRQMAGMLVSDEKIAVEICQAMNDTLTSVLYRRVKIVDGKPPKNSPKTYVNLKTLSDLVRRDMLNNISVEPLASKQEIIERYFAAWKAIYSGAWADEKTHVLVKAMGFSIMAHVFDKVMDLATSKYSTEIPTMSQFQSVVKLLLPINVPVKFDDGTSKDVALNWASATFGKWSSGKGINALSNEIRKFLVKAKHSFLKSR